MYVHRIIRFNYTTYDIRRSQDVINPGTSHCNIMLLNKQAAELVDANDEDAHPFLYARIIGIYHANIIYTGPGMINYNPIRFNFLWVRWYQHIPNKQPCQLDRLTFPDIADENAFGFVDPADVLRGCHIIPAFRPDADVDEEKGSTEPEWVESKCAHSGDDSKTYYIGR